MIISNKWTLINVLTKILYKERRKTALNDNFITLNKVWIDYSFISGCAKIIYIKS